MPIHLRRFHIKKINEYNKKHNEEYDKLMNQSKQPFIK
jgi:succinate dehydrogenase flavin-adding protein (antitoxin of CptAB toxin-antitoxin module)